VGLKKENQMNHPPFLNKTTIIFDLDGTLINLKKSTIKACFYALTKIYGAEIPKVITKKHISKLVGRPFTLDLAALLGWNPKTTSEFTKYYTEGKEKFAHLNKLTKNIIKTLNNLQTSGKTLCLVTNKTRIETNRLLSSFGLEKYFSKIVCRDDGNFSAKSDMIATLGVSLDDIVIFGNMQGDIVNGASFVRSLSSYGDILVQIVKSFTSSFNSLILNLFTTPLKYKLDGFT